MKMKSRTTVSAVPIIILIVIALAVMLPTVIKWAPLSNLGSLLHFDNSSTVVKEPQIRVWVNKRSGLYYCSSSTFYGKISPGFYMKQGNAVQRGYRPVDGEVCKQ